MPQANGEGEELMDAAISQWADHYHGDSGYQARALLRAAAIVEQKAAALPEGYSRFWHEVDAEILRRRAQGIVTEGQDPQGLGERSD
jgi:hypothetical protein